MYEYITILGKDLQVEGGNGEMAEVHVDSIVYPNCKELHTFLNKVEKKRMVL